MSKLIVISAPSGTGKTSLIKSLIKELDSLKLVNFLDKYAETGTKYTDVLKKIITQNNLVDFDDVEILPTSLKMKNLI